MTVDMVEKVRNLGTIVGGMLHWCLKDHPYKMFVHEKKRIL